MPIRAKKMVGIARFDKEQSDAEREQRRPQVEQRKATPIKNHRHADHGVLIASGNSHFSFLHYMSEASASYYGVQRNNAS